LKPPKENMTTHVISKEDFEVIRPLLDVRKKTRPRTHDLYDVFSAIVYRFDNKIPWRQLPPCYPPWRTVHEYSRIWRGLRLEDNVLKAAFEKLGWHDLISSLEKTGVMN
jgi:transposase